MNVKINKPSLTGARYARSKDNSAGEKRRMSDSSIEGQESPELQERSTNIVENSGERTSQARACSFGILPKLALTNII